MDSIRTKLHPWLLEVSSHYRIRCRQDEAARQQNLQIGDLKFDLRKKNQLFEFITRETKWGSLIWLLTTQENLTLIGTVQFRGKNQKEATWNIYSNASYNLESVLTAETEVRVDFKTNSTFMELVNFTTYENGKGYGSIFMDYFKPYCAKRGCSYISGRLSPVDTKDPRDSEHEARMLHFYQKHGFKTRLKENGDGSMFLDLAKSEYHVDDSEPI